MRPLWSKSATYNLSGPFLPLQYFVFHPQFPASISRLPSLSTSFINTVCHNPVDNGNCALRNFPFLFMKIVSGIHSPAVTRSGRPSLSISANEALETIPIDFSEIMFSPAIENFPLPSLISKYDVCGTPYAFASASVPKKRS